MLRRSLAVQYATLDRSSESYGLIWIDFLSRRFSEVLLEQCLDLLTVSPALTKDRSMVPLEYASSLQRVQYRQCRTCSALRL
jgi:hypothetical protein